jgi:hypothetical protein
MARNQGENDPLKVLLTLSRRVIFTLSFEKARKHGGLGLVRLLLNSSIRHPIGVHMRNIIQPLAWFAALGSFIAVASSVALGLV